MTQDCALELANHLRATTLVDEAEVPAFIDRVKNASNELIYGSNAPLWNDLKKVVTRFDEPGDRPSANPLQTAIDAYLEDVSLATSLATVGG